MHTTIRIAIIAAALLTTSAATASEPDRCEVNKATAQRELAAASNLFLTCGAPDSQRCNVARALLATTMERSRTAEASCTVVEDSKLAKRIAKLTKAKQHKHPKRTVVLTPAAEVDPFESDETLPPAPSLVPVPGVPWLVDPIVERECPGLLCPIVVVAPPR
jgi:hypothetical protein